MVAGRLHISFFSSSNCCATEYMMKRHLHTRHLFHQTPFTLGTSCATTKHVLYQPPLAPNTFFHQTHFTANALYTKFYSKHLYTRDLLHLVRQDVIARSDSSSMHGHSALHCWWKASCPRVCSAMTQQSLGLLYELCLHLV